MKIFAVLLGAGLMYGANPPCQIGMTVVTGALNDKAKIVEFNPVTGLYKVQFSNGETEYEGPRQLLTCTAPPLTPVAESWFTGVWQLHSGGGGAWGRNPATGSWKMYALDVAGAPPIMIKADGTFEWILNNTETAKGQWRKPAGAEIKFGFENGNKGTMILLVKGESGANWLVTRDVHGTKTGSDRILLERLDVGLQFGGTRVPEKR